MKYQQSCGEGEDQFDLPEGARAFAENMAVNTPVQGSAADVIKKAMIEIAAELEAGGFAARMILQVHDELVFDAPESEAEALGERVRALMEGAYALEVPLVVDLGTGANWREAH